MIDLFSEIRKTAGRLIGALFGVIMVTGASSTFAQDAAEWQTACADGRCTISRSLTEEKTERRFLTLLFVFENKGEDAVMVLSAPLGIAIEPGIRVVYADQTFDAPVKACFPDGCQAVRPVTDDELAAMAKHGSIDVRYFAYGHDKPLSGIIKLDGLTDTVAKVKASL